MPNPGKYKSVGVAIESYQKLTELADYEDRAIGRQLSRMIEEAYDSMQEEITRKQVARPYNSSSRSRGIASVIED